MLVDDILKSLEQCDTSAYDLVEVIVERRDSSARDSRYAELNSLIANEKQEIRNIRRHIHCYNIEENERKQRLSEEREQVQMFIALMQELQNNHSYDECMFQIYKHFRRWISENTLSRCDYVLKYVSTDDFNIHILISLLMASYPFRSRLSYRSMFYEKVLIKARITYTSEDIKRIFGGLK